jgi:hypothetical protein
MYTKHYNSDMFSLLFNKIFSGTQPHQLVAGRKRRFRNYLCPHHQGCDVTETSVSTCNQLTQLCAREDFIEFSHRESFKLYISLLLL